MNAVVLDRFGGPEELRWGQVPDLTPASGEVLIHVAASSVNRADVMQRMGHYPPPAGESEILGLECSGRVAVLGADVSTLAVGDEVCALLAGGGYAEQVAVPAAQCMRIPTGIELLPAGGLPEIACTVYSNLTRTARLKPGETFLVHGGAGGIGTFAIQYAVALGARVAVTAGSADKLEICRALGAQILVNYNEEDFVDVVGRADVILDNMGAKYLARNVSVLAPDGRIVVIGLQGGRKAELSLGELLPKRGSIHATSLRSRPRSQKGEICGEVVEHVWPLIEAGKIRMVIDRTYDLPDAADAHRRIDSGDHVGKILLKGTTA
jgi:putative PIG3 family NAD(P)H quinone oxidoreductase